MSDSVPGQPLPSAEDLFAGSSEAILVHDPDDGMVLDANPTAERLYGYAADQLRGTQISSLLAGDREKETDVTTLADTAETVTWHVEHTDDERRWLEVSFQRAPTNEYILSFGRDVTSETIQETALTQREQALETAIDGMAILDPDRRFVYANRPYAEMHGYDDPDALLGAEWATLYAPDEWKHLENRIKPALADQGEWRGEAVGERADGDSFQKEVSIQTLSEGGYVVVVRDVSDLREHERRLRENQQTLRKLGEIVSDREADLDGKVASLLDLGRDWLDLSVGYMTRIDDGEQTVEAAVGDHTDIQEGATAPLSETYCEDTLGEEGEQVVRGIEDAERAGLTGTDAFERFGLSCYLGSTVTVGGTTYGTVCFADTEPRDRPFTGLEQTFVDLVTQWVGQAIERERQAETLRAEHELTETILESSPTALVVFDGDGRVQLANERASTLLWDGRDLVGQQGLPLSLYRDGEPVPPAEMPQKRVARTGTPVEGVDYRLGSGRDSRDLSVSARPLEQGGDRGVVLTVTDVTERQERARTLEVQRERMDALLDNAPLVLFALDDAGEFVESRGAGLSAFNLEDDELVGETIYDVFGHDEAVIGDYEQARDGDAVESVRTLDGTTFRTWYRPVETQGRTAVIGVAIDITVQKRRERKLANRVEAMDAATEGLAILDPDGRYEYANEAHAAVYGYDDPDTMIGEHWKTCYDDSEIERFEDEVIPELYDVGEWRGEATGVRADGSTFPQAVSLTALDNGGLVCVVRDITDERRRERRLEAVREASEELLYATSPDSVADTVVDIVGDLLPYPMAVFWRPDPDGEALQPVAATDAVEAMLEVDDPTADLPWIEPGSLEMDVFEAGETRVIEDYDETGAAMGADEPLRTVMMVPLGDHGVFHIGSPERDPPSETVQDLVAILARNAEAALASATRQARLEEYRDELERSNESLQQFAYIASHDLQEPLRMVSSFVDLLETEYGDELDDEAREYMEFAVDGAHRMQEMVDALLQYSRVETRASELEPTDPNAVLDSTLDGLRMHVEETDATVESGDLPPVRADPSQLGQLFQNLVENAVTYADEAGVSPQVEVSGTRADGMVRFTVTDNGPGIPEEAGDDVFEIFSRGGAHEADGTGIGLALCDRIVTRHDGRIWTESAAGDGATFHFTLPAVEDDDE